MPSGSRKEVEKTTVESSGSLSAISISQSIEKLNGDMASATSNYDSWSFRMIQMRKEKNLYSASVEKDDSAE